MKTFYIEHYSARMQNHIYAGLNDFASNNDNEDICAARLCGLPVAILDVTIETLKHPLKIIEAVAFAIINFFGALCSDNCSMKDAIYSLETALTSAAATVIGAALAPLKIFYQTIAITYDPEFVQSINYQHEYAESDHAVMYPESNEDLFDKLKEIK